MLNIVAVLKNNKGSVTGNHLQERLFHIFIGELLLVFIRAEHSFLPIVHLCAPPRHLRGWVDDWGSWCLSTLFSLFLAILLILLDSICDCLRSKLVIIILPSNGHSHNRAWLLNCCLHCLLKIILDRRPRKFWQSRELQCK